MEKLIKYWAMWINMIQTKTMVEDPPKDPLSSHTLCESSHSDHSQDTLYMSISASPCDNITDSDGPRKSITQN